MSVIFTRTRSRDRGSVSRSQWLMHNGGKVQCVDGPWTVSPEGQFSRLLVNRESIMDCYPHGKYHEGEFKIGSVIRQRVMQSTTTHVCSLLYEPCTNGTLSHFGQGMYVWPLRFTPVGDTPIAPAFVNNDINALCRSALANANSPDVGLGETFAEGKAGLEMLLRPMSGLRHLFLTAHFGKPGARRMMRNARDASSAWLELRYGWTPLVMTVLDLIKGLPNYVTDKIYDAKASVVTSSVSHLAETSLKVPNSGIRYWYDGQIESTVRKTGRVYFKVVDANAYNRKKLGLDVLDLPQLAYELTRLSFAVDWWFNLGDYIAALIPNPYIQVLGYTYAERSLIVSQSRLKKIGTTVPKRFADGIFTEEKETYRREVVTPNVAALPTIDFEYRSWKHLVDSLGLIIQNVPRNFGAKKKLTKK